MTNNTIVVAGGGHAGIHAVKAIQKYLKKVPSRIVLLDPQPAHLRKVQLFKAAVGEKKLMIPWSECLPEGTGFVRGAIQSVNPSGRRLEYRDQHGTMHELDYDVLVLAMGSIVRKHEGKGYSLSGIEEAEKIHQKIEDHVQKAANEKKPLEKRRLLSLAVIGGGISGIETVFELNQFMKKRAELAGLDPDEVNVQLIHSQETLLPDGTEKLRQKLLKRFEQHRIDIRNGKKVLKSESGILHLSDGEKIPVGISVWTIGLQPNPVVQSLGLPVGEDGRLTTDFSYRVLDSHGIYSIGDCAHIVDPVTGKTDGMTCKDAISQAKRLGKIISSDLTGRRAPVHRSIRQTFCFSLGTGDALVWAKVFGIEILIGRKVGWVIRKVTWNLASLTK